MSPQQEEMDRRRSLERAIETGQICAQFQPIVELGSGRIVATEALARWDHPELGLIAPGDFLPLAEETGLILPLGRYVLNLACSQAGSWRERYPDRPMKMCVNLSDRQLFAESLIDDVERALRGSQISEGSLVLEVSGSLFFERLDEVTERVAALKELGVTIALDGLDADRHSLRTLTRVRVDFLKLDRSFTRGLVVEPELSVIARVILEAAEDLSLGTVAQGIELSDQVVELRRHECRWGQGFYFAKPLHAAALDALFESGCFSFEWLEDLRDPQIVLDEDAPSSDLLSIDTSG